MISRTFGWRSSVWSARSGKARDVDWLELQVRGIEHEYLASRPEVSRPQRVGDAAPHPMPGDAEELVLCDEPFQHLPRVILGAVVDDDDLVPDRRARERGGRLLHEEWQVRRFVLGGNEDGDVDLPGRRSEIAAAGQTGIG